jgi:hypothetical protein
LPGSVLLSRTPLRRTRSRALRAASRARAASIAFWMTRLAMTGFSSRKAPRRSLTIVSTMPLTSVFPSFVLVWPSNCGCGILTLMTPVSPSRMSSPLMVASLRSFARLLLAAYELMVRVSAERNPDRCVPPSCVLMLLANVKISSE